MRPPHSLIGCIRACSAARHKRPERQSKTMRKL
jgi:hypothetical protein